MMKDLNVILSKVERNTSYLRSHQYSPSSCPQFRQGDPHSYSPIGDNHDHKFSSRT